MRTYQSMLTVESGTSPHKRAESRRPSPRPNLRRNIPARAGRGSCATRPYFVMSGPSPHTRGEEFCGSAGHELGWVHPRVRGERRDYRNLLHDQNRTIPACTGRSLSPRPRRRNTWEHPRVHRDQAQPLSAAHLSAGASPRARGEGRSRRSRLPHSGSIPACAGRRLGDLHRHMRFHWFAVGARVSSPQP